MLKRKWLPILILALGGIAMVTLIQKNSEHSRPIRLGIGGEWKSLHPGLQHTMWAGLVLSNQFDTLVGTDEHGGLQPCGAKSWSISKDFREFTFKIDPSKRFSDGAPLRADDFKRSWEESYRLEPKSANSSLLDTLYQIEGFENFEKNKTISGILVVDDETLRVRFRRPFRMALDYFDGARLSAYRNVGTKLIGTGKFVIEETSPTALKLTPNPYNPESKGLGPVELSLVWSRDAKAALLENRIDAMAYTMGSRIFSDVAAQPDLQVLPGPEAIHIVLNINGLAGHLFENSNLRRALQFIIYSRISREPTLIGAKEYFSLDPQIFLPAQAGRLDRSEAERIIKEGEQFIPELVEASKKHPIHFISDPIGFWVTEELKKFGVSVSEKSGPIPQGEHFNYMYNRQDYDLFATTFSVLNGDPDGIYHALGERGSILAPIIYRKTVGALLEEGRKLLDQEVLDSHYKNVSRAALEEVPFVHLGFSRAVAIINRDRVEANSDLMQRNYGHLDVFKLK
ncbi:ABC transporter substrate-binding protein [Bdellovibrionota bacterium FG-2]